MKTTTTKPLISFVLGGGRTGVGSCTTTFEGIDKKIPTIRLVNLDESFKVGQDIMYRNLKENSTVDLYFTSLEALEVLQKSLNFSRDLLIAEELNE